MIRTRLQGATPFFPNMLNNGKVEVCLKEDVDKTLAEKDKVIADLIEKNKRLANKDMIMASETIKDLEESHKMEVEQLLMEIVRLKEAQRWRKFPDEKPTEDIKFLVINEKGFIQCCYYSPILKEFQIPVTHWMPLPKHPEEK